jgi:hypothetical protein
VNNPITGSGRLDRSQRRRTNVLVLVTMIIASGLQFACPGPTALQRPNCIKFERNPWSIPPAQENWSGCCYHKDDPSRIGTVAIETLPTGAKRARCNF